MLVAESPLEIFLADDNYADVRWLQIVLVELHIQHTLSVVYDSEQAELFLRKAGPYICAPTPDLAFIDVNMPKLTGIEVLERVGVVANWPICILTSSPLEKEIVLQRFKLDERRYILKPIDREKLLSVLDSFEQLKQLAAEIRSRAAQV